MDKKISRASLFDALNAYQVPGTSATLVALKAVKGLDVDGGRITVRLQMLDAYQDREAEIRKAIQQRIGSVDGVESVTGRSPGTRRPRWSSRICWGA